MTFQGLSSEEILRPCNTYRVANSSTKKQTETERINLSNTVVVTKGRIGNAFSTALTAA